MRWVFRVRRSFINIPDNSNGDYNSEILDLVHDATGLDLNADKVRTLVSENWCVWKSKHRIRHTPTQILD